MNLEDLRTAIAAANVNQAKGNFDGQQQAYTIGANDQLLTSDGLHAADRSRIATARRSSCRTWPTSIDDAENAKPAAWMNGRRR